MFQMSIDTYLEETSFMCPECCCVNSYYPESPTPRNCRICSFKLFPRVDDIQESPLYRTLYHYAKENPDDRTTKSQEGKSVRKSGDI
jgi:hypothetical protein